MISDVFHKRKGLSRQLCHQRENSDSVFPIWLSPEVHIVAFCFVPLTICHVFYCFTLLDKPPSSLPVCGVWRPEPVERMPASGGWQWPRSAQTSRWCAFHWTWGLGASCSLSPQRPILSLWPTAHTVTFSVAMLHFISVQSCTHTVRKTVKGIQSC